MRVKLFTKESCLDVRAPIQKHNLAIVHQQLHHSRASHWGIRWQVSPLGEATQADVLIRNAIEEVKPLVLKIKKGCMTADTSCRRTKSWGALIWQNNYFSLYTCGNIPNTGQVKPPMGCHIQRSCLYSSFHLQLTATISIKMPCSINVPYLFCISQLHVAQPPW